MAEVVLSLLVLKTRQLAEVRRFYAVLGLDLSEERHGAGPVHYAARVGPVVLELYPLAAEGPAADATTRLGFTVERLAEVVARLRSAGATVVREPQSTAWGHRAVVRDPDGRAVELHER